MGSVQAVARSLRILDMLFDCDADPVQRERGVTVQSLSAEVRIHRTTALRLLSTLIEAGYAAPSPAGSHGYVLGPALRHGVGLIDANRRLKDAVHPFLEELTLITGECAHAAVAAGGRALVIDDVETDQPLRVVPTQGRHVGLHCTSAGKVLLAWNLAQIPAELPQRTARTITDRAVLEAHLSDIRAQGYALDDEENGPWTRCISAPVFDVSGSPVGCVGIDAPSVRLPLEIVASTAAQVQEVARSVSRALGHRQDVKVL